MHKLAAAPLYLLAAIFGLLAVAGTVIGGLYFTVIAIQQIAGGNTSQGFTTLLVAGPALAAVASIGLPIAGGLWTLADRLAKNVHPAATTGQNVETA